MLLNPADSVLFYSQQTREANNTVRSTIKLRSNKTRREANKTGVVSLRVQRLRHGSFCSLSYFVCVASFVLVSVFELLRNGEYIIIVLL